MMKKIISGFFLFICIGVTKTIRAQQQSELQTIERLAASGNYQKAATLLHRKIQYFISSGQLDTVVKYVVITGTITGKLKGENEAVKAVYSLTEQLSAARATPRQMAKAYNNAAYFLYTINRFQQCYKTCQLQLKSALNIIPASNSEVADAHFYLGEYAGFMNDYQLALKHHRMACNIRFNAAVRDEEDIFLSLEALAKVMLYTSQTDSASFYYGQALKSLGEMKPNNMNLFYRPATTYKNLAIIANSEGKTEEAIRYSYKAINLLKTYINKENHKTQKGAKTDLGRMVDNLSIYYSQLGNITRANDLLHYSYELKKSHLNENSVEILNTEVLLASNYNNIGDYERAKLYAQKAIERAGIIESGQLFAHADAWNILASVNTNNRKTAEAGKCFAIADSLYRVAYQGFYDDMYMEFLRNFAVFHAQNGLHEEAIKRALDVYNYLVANGKKESLQAFYQLLNIAKVNYYAGRYKAAITYCDLAVKIINIKLSKRQNKIDSVKMEIYLPQVMLTRAMSEYKLQPDKNQAFLNQTLSGLEKAMAILESRKGIIDDAYNINFLLECNRDLIDFAKKIALNLYTVTLQKKYLEKFINLHESGLYNRIRSRLDKERAVGIAKISPILLAEEIKLKTAIAGSLGKEEQSGDAIRTYLQNVQNLEKHIEKVKREYPEYYKLRYATLFQSLSELQSAIPEKTTLVRYYFVDSSLIAVVANREIEKVVSLKIQGLEDKIQRFLIHRSTEKEQLDLSYQLYQQLWAPLASLVKTEKVLIIPDGILYNIGFEMLPFEPASSYKQLATKSLLAKHIISYHYSAFILTAPKPSHQISDNYIAFAPGFSDELKEAYLKSLNDSMHLDQSYMTLLPQPVSGILAKKIKSLLGGDIFLAARSTMSSFKTNAASHKLIHIATHAVYNDAAPEKSGLIFAKETSRPDSNRLYLKDIYNCDLSSELTLLTACESGRSGYQDGEGMVSLAHAFNYAGSRSIVMALWKIDEHASAMIMESFIRYIKKGMATDEALRNAKLDYLKQAEGRLTDPCYWSGMVLMGVPETIKLAPTNRIYYWLFGGVTLVTASSLLYLFKRRSKSNRSKADRNRGLQ